MSPSLLLELTWFSSTLSKESESDSSTIFEGCDLELVSVGDLEESDVFLLSLIGYTDITDTDTDNRYWYRYRYDLII